MAWVRIEDAVTEHQKHLKAGPAASWLWVCGIAYCQRQLSDGFIPDEAVGMLGVPKGVKVLIERLVSVGLFHRTEGGYLVHDYHDFNDTRAEALARKHTVSEQRREAGRASGRRRAVQRDSNGTVERTLNPIPSHPIPSHPDPDRKGRDPVARVALQGGGVMAGALPREHLRHAHCGRVCVPDFLHGEFLPKLGGDADARLRAFYVATLAAISDEQDIGDEPPKFWRAHFARAFGLVAPTGPKALTVEELLAND